MTLPAKPPVPYHLCVIMDGNRRWAAERGMPAAIGHANGARQVRQLVEGCFDRGIKYLTLFAFRSALSRRVSKQIAVGFMALLVLAQARADHVQSGVVLANPLDLNGVLREAFMQHPDIRARRDEKQAALDRLEAARWGRYPGLSAQVETRPGGPQTILRLEQPVWNGGRINSQIGVAQAELRLAGASLSESQLDVLQRSAGAFFDILRLESRLKTAVINEAEHLRLVEIIQRRVTAGVSPSTDETQAAARWRQAVIERIQTLRQIDTARLLLAQLMGQPVTGLQSPVTVHTGSWNEDTLLEAAMRISPERQRLLALVDAAESQISLAQSQIMPSLVVGYQSRVGTLPFGEERNRAYLGVQVQTGSGLSQQSNIRAAVAKKSAAVEAIDAHDRRLTQSVRTTLTEIVALTAQIEPSRNLLLNSDEIVAGYLRQFQVGRKNWLDVLNAQREKTQAEYAFYDLEYPLMLASVRLMLLAGRWDASTLSLSHAP